MKITIEFDPGELARGAPPTVTAAGGHAGANTLMMAPAAYAATVGAAIVICWVVNVGSAARLGGITATIMLLVPGVGSPWDRALLRLGEVTLGTVCALLVTLIMSRIEKHWFGRPDKA